MTTESTNTGLDIADIQSVVAIIDYSAEQGAFKGWQIINQVAGVRSRLSSFLDVVAAAQKAQADAAADATPVAESETPTDTTAASAPADTTPATGA